MRDGGGISSRGPNTLTITDSTIARNTAGRAGGGIGTTPSTSIITITGSTINDNVGSSIGGIWLNGGSLNVSNSTVSGNQASAGSNLPAGLGTVRGSATLDSVTIANNVHSVASGGGLRIESGTITNTLLNNNSPADCVIAFTPPPSGGNNLDSDGSCSLAGTGDISNGNANLGPLQNNGGPTETHALLTGSDAIDMGSTSLATDQRGVLRPVGLDSDIGAFESGVDIELVALQLRSVDPIDVDTAFDVFFDVTVENNAGVDPVDADVSVSLTAPPDCVVTAPGPQVATISGLNVPLDLTFAFGVICDQTSFHDFTGTASVFPVDPDLVELNLDNNDEGPVTITRPVIREVDGGVLSSVTRLFFGETSISVNEPVLGSIRSETANLRLSPDDPSDGVVFRITFDITAPPDCTVNGGATSTEFSFVLLAVDDSRFISAIPELQCSTPGFHTFTFESTLAPRDLHVIDINPLNDQGSGDLIVAVDAVDIELVALELRSIDPIDVNTAFDVFFDVTVENNAGVDPVDAGVSVSLTAPPDCVVTAPGPQTVTLSGPNVPVDLTLAVGVICSQPSFHDFTGTASVAPTVPDLVDGNLNNNDGGPVTIRRPVIREVDGSVLSVVTRLFLGETSIPVNEPVLGSVRTEISSLRLSPDDPSDGVVFVLTLNATAPPDCTVDGGATASVFSFILLAVDQIRLSGSELPELQCSTPGFHTFTFESTLAPRDLHVIDINPLNDQGSGDLIVAVDAVDIELVALQLRSIDPIDVNTAFDVFFDVTVENNAGVDPVDAGVSVSLTAPPDCVVTAPGPQAVTFSGLDVPVDLTFTFGVICDQTSFHDFTGTASVFPVDPDLVDGNLNNNDGGPVTITRPVNANPSLDADGDNIIDDVDVNPADPSNDSFSDVSLAGSTSGTITTRGDQLLLIRDDLDPVKGIRIAANPFSGPTPAQFSVCSNSATFALDAGDAATVTCGSVSIEVLVGTVQVEFLADDGSTATAELNQGDTLTFEPTTITFTAPESNPNTVVVLIDGVELTIEPNETVLPFSTFNAKLKIKRSPRADHDSFRLKGSFNLGAGSDGIDILHEDVVLQIGTYSTLIQAGFFEFKDRGRHGKYKFRGVIDGVNLKVVIKPQGDESYKLEARGKGADLSGTENPVLVTLAVGEDKGSVSVTAKIRDKKRSGGDDDSGSDDDDSGSDDDDSSSDD